MAANAKFSNCLQPALRRAKADCLGETSSGDGVKRVNKSFSELESAVAVLEDKYNDRSTGVCQWAMFISFTGNGGKGAKEGSFEDYPSPSFKAELGESMGW